MFNLINVIFVATIITLMVYTAAHSMADRISIELDAMHDISTRY